MSISGFDNEIEKISDIFIGSDRDSKSDKSLEIIPQQNQTFKILSTTNNKAEILTLV